MEFNCGALFRPFKRLSQAGYAKATLLLDVNIIISLFADMLASEWRELHKTNKILLVIDKLIDTLELTDANDRSS